MMLFLLLIAANLQTSVPATPGRDAPPVAARPYVPNRLNPERIDSLVVRPIALAKAGDVDGARRFVDQMLARIRARHGDNSVEEADLLMAFGVALHLLADSSEDEEEELGALAGTYVKRSIPAYRAAFGADHPEVATALTSHADILRFAAPDDPPPAAEEAMEEAYRIRLAALGENHAETIWTSLYLIDIRSAPARVNRNPALIEVAAAQLERAAELSQASDRETATELPAKIHLRRARLYARYGRAEDARRALRAAQAEAARMEAADSCLMLALAESEVAERLAAARGASEEHEVNTLDLLACIDRES